MTKKRSACEACEAPAGSQDGQTPQISPNHCRQCGRELTKPKHPGGRPSTGLTESAQLVEGPRWLLYAARDAARAEGISIAEWWRRAGRAALGIREPIPPPGAPPARQRP
jgi:hypothetical protein